MVYCPTHKAAWYCTPYISLYLNAELISYYRQVLKKASLYGLSSEESDTKVSYSNSNQAVSFTRNKAFQQATSNDDKVSGGTSLPPAINNPM